MDKLKAKFGALSTMEKLEYYISTGKMQFYYVTNSGLPGLPGKLYIDGRRQIIDNCSVSIKDSGGLINIWGFNKNTLYRLLLLDNVSKSKSLTIVNSLADWYDRDNFIHIFGAEENYYKEHGYNYTPRNFNGLQSIYEWHDVKGLTDNKTFDKIKKYLILSPKWHPNINTMDSKLLAATLDIPISTAKALIKLRSKRGGLTIIDIKNILGNGMAGRYYDIFPTFILDINLKFKFNDAMEGISADIDFLPDKESAYRILRWEN